MQARRGITKLAVMAVCLSSAAAVCARAPSSQPVEINLRAGSLSDALAELGRTKRVDLLYDEHLVSGRRTDAIHERLTIEEALTRLLAGTQLGFRRTSENAFIVTQMGTDKIDPTLSTDAAVPEILVIGVRTQNNDIRRTQNDIQPRRVFTSREVQDAHSSSFEEFARTRITGNTQIASPAQDPVGQSGSTRSEINLRGLGPTHTLVLVDGRRMPDLPLSIIGMGQSDLNGIPTAMIERVEVVTAPAGGIYGTGATAGAINVILKRDYRGAEASVTSGITSRGDGQQIRLDGRLGFSPDGGDTDVMIAGSLTRSQTFSGGQRDYLVRSRALQLANDPTDFYASYPLGNAINISKTTGQIIFFVVIVIILGATTAFALHPPRLKCP